MSECAVPKKKKELTAPCPRLSRANSRSSRTQLHRVGPVYRVATEQGIMHEIMTSGPVQGMEMCVRILTNARATDNREMDPEAYLCPRLAPVYSLLNRFFFSRFRFLYNIISGN